MSTKAIVGRGTVLSIGSGGTTETFTPVAEIKTIKLSGRKLDTEDVSSLDSSAHEFVGTLPESGEWDLSGNRVGTDAGQTAMESAFAAGALHSFKIALPKANGQVTTGDTWAFSALVTELTYDIDAAKSIGFSAKLKISGTLTMTVGA